MERVATTPTTTRAHCEILQFYGIGGLVRHVYCMNFSRSWMNRTMNLYGLMLTLTIRPSVSHIARFYAFVTLRRRKSE